MKKYNNAIQYIKGISIFSVICAHCNAVYTDYTIAKIGSLLLQNIGNIGVIIFFIMSGSLAWWGKSSKDKFIKKKIKNIGIPWLLSGTAVFLYVYLRKPPLTLNGWLNFIIGNGSYLYYLSILMMLYIIFAYLPFMTSISTLVICQIITAVSTLWFYSLGAINPYLNLFNWIGYFALGVLIRKNTLYVDKILILVEKYRFILYLIYVIALIYQYINGNGGSYFGGCNVIICWIGVLCVITMGIRINKKKNILSKIIYALGENTLFIYLWHMPIAGIIARIMVGSRLEYFVLCRPVIVCGIILIVMKIITVIIKRYSLEKYTYVIGFRMN